MHNPVREVLVTSPGSTVRPTALSALPPLKRSFDVSAVLCAALFISPLILASIAVLLLLQGRPIFIRHQRIGKSGKPFPCLKFRTMVTDADAVLQQHLAESPSALDEWQKTFKLKNDPRVTWLGRFLRKSSLDEIPQLWNILKGEMSLVGPRPIVEAEKPRYGMHIEHYCRVRPGLTGLWQVKGRSDTDYDTRVQLDVEYVSSMSLLRDLKIMAMTIPAVLMSKGSY